MTGKMDWLIKEQQRVLQLQLPRSHVLTYTCFTDPSVCQPAITEPPYERSLRGIKPLRSTIATFRFCSGWSPFAQGPHEGALWPLLLQEPYFIVLLLITRVVLLCSQVCSRHAGTGWTPDWWTFLFYFDWPSWLIGQVFTWKYPENISHTVNTAIIGATKGSLKIGRSHQTFIIWSNQYETVKSWRIIR